MFRKISAEFVFKFCANDRSTLGSEQQDILAKFVSVARAPKKRQLSINWLSKFVF